MPKIIKRQIGGCTLYLGDCLSVLKSLPDQSIDMVFTDPPYGHNNNNNGDLISRVEKALGQSKTLTKRNRAKVMEERPIANDGEEANELFRQTLPQISRLLMPGCCCCCCCGGGGPDPQFARWSMWIDSAIGFKHMVVWDKGPMGMGWHYRRSYETVLVAEKPGGKCRWFDDSGKIENIIRPGMYGIRKIIPKKDQHPTEKPVELSKHFIRLHTQPEHIVCDPFMGCGSTGVACVQLGRKFIGIEIDPEHFELACKKIKREVSLQKARLFHA